MEPPLLCNIGFISSAVQVALSRTMTATKTADINWAISQLERLVRHTSSAHPDYEPVLSSYAAALLLRWENSHQMEDIRKAIISLERALDILPHSPSIRRYQNLVNLGAAYMGRYEIFSSDPNDINYGIEYWEQAHTTATSLGYTREAVSIEMPPVEVCLLKQLPR
jgi:hypothetical protein